MKPIHNKYETTETLKLFDGMTLSVLLSGSDTNGLLSVFEDIVEPGLGPCQHIHHKQDETFIFLEGTFDVKIDGKLFRMNAGDTAFIPKGSIHGWKNVGKEMGRLRYIFSPALNIEQMFRDLSNAHENGELTEKVMKKIASDYPEQESTGPPI